MERSLTAHSVGLTAPVGRRQRVDHALERGLQAVARVGRGHDAAQRSQRRVLRLGQQPAVGPELVAARPAPVRGPVLVVLHQVGDQARYEAQHLRAVLGRDGGLLAQRGARPATR